MTFLQWDQNTADKFPYRVVLMSDLFFNFDKEKDEMKNRKKWALDNSTKPIMLANGGHMLCFNSEIDAMAFKLMWT